MPETQKPLEPRDIPYEMGYRQGLCEGRAEVERLRELNRKLREDNVLLYATVERYRTQALASD